MVLIDVNGNLRIEPCDGESLSGVDRKCFIQAVDISRDVKFFWTKGYFVKILTSCIRKKIRVLFFSDMV